MTKVKTADGISENSHRNIKNGTTNKKKHQKFKKTPKGKIALINDSYAQSNGNPKNHKNGVNFQLQTKLSKGGNEAFTNPRASTSGVKYPEVKIEPKEEKSDNDLSNESIIEEIMIKAEDDKEFDGNSDTENAVENIGIKMFESMKQEIKEEPSSDDTEDATENKGMKMFGSLKQEVKEEPSSDDTEDATENKGMKMFESLKQEVKEELSSSDDGNGDDEDEESEEDEEDEKAALDLVALLGPSIAEESNDEDFEATENDSDDDDEYDEESEDEDYEDLSPDIAIVKSEKNYEKGAVNENACRALELTKGRRKECNERTVFISNVPKDSNISALQKEFRQFGIMESMTLRGNVPLNPNLPGKVAVILKKKRLKTKTVSYFIRYQNEDSVKKALSMNGMEWDGNILKVKISRHRERLDNTKGVLLMHLPFTIQDKEIRKLFKQCGPIDALNVFRSRKTGQALGRGYVNFESVHGAVQALNLDGTTIKNHEIRVMPNVAAWRKEQWIQKNKKKPKTKPEKTKTVYLPNLPFTTEDNDLRKLFDQCGPIKSVKILRNRKKRKCGLVNFGSVDGATMAIGLNGTTFKNHEIRIMPDYTLARRKERQIENKNRKRLRSGTVGSPSRKKRKTANSEAVVIATNNINAEKRKLKNEASSMRKQKRISKRLEDKKQRVESDSTPHGKGKGKHLAQKADAKKKLKQKKSAKKKKQTAT